ncbi:glutamate receptor ionotropic, NMDA 3A-like [Tubulanus polymorphus]|uniref:glutamate receptor ionotropic, NMDA 3A-like n=1 Tax=Tubulanus polymorphus TaxID=672921 RepID=UPI003DA6A2F8
MSYGRAENSLVNKKVVTIGAVFDMNPKIESNLSRCFLDAIQDMRSEVRTFELKGIVLTKPEYRQNPASLCKSFCRQVEDNSVNVLFGLGSLNVIESLSMLSNTADIPAIGFSTGEIKYPAEGEERMYLQIDLSDGLLAEAMMQVLDVTGIRYLSILMDDNYAKYQFLHAFNILAQTNDWSVEDAIFVSRTDSQSELQLKMLSLKENISRIVILFCHRDLARRVMKQAFLMGLFDNGYAWFLADTSPEHDNDIQYYPLGVVRLEPVPPSDFRPLIRDVVRLVIKASESYIGNSPAALYLHRNYSCWSKPLPVQRNRAISFYNAIKDTEIVGETGPFTFNQFGARIQGKYEILNVVYEHGSVLKKWRHVGHVTNGSATMESIVWPGNAVSRPVINGIKTFRVVTNNVMPFVMNQKAYLHEDSMHEYNCGTAEPCLRVNTSNSDVLTAIFEDFKKHVHNDSRPYEVHCCSGLTIKLFQQLSKDLKFDFNLYLVADRKYGKQLANNTWNGMVADIQSGAADIAIGAFSITNSRLAVIDFTQHYFQSGFSMMINEHKGKTPPLNAIFEPFGPEVWFSITGCASVAAIAMAIFEWNSPFGLTPKARKRDKNYTLASAATMVWSVLFGHTVKTKTPKSWPCKVLQNVWAGCSIFIVASYTANLAAYLAGETGQKTFSGINDPKLIYHKVAVVNSSAAEEHLRKVNHALYLKRITLEDDKVPVRSLLNGSLDVYLDDTPILEYAKTQLDDNCSLKIVGESFGDDGYGFGLTHGSPMKEPISRKLIEYRTNGFLEELRNDYFSYVPCRSYPKMKDDARDMGLTYNQFLALFAALGAGVFVSIFILCNEHAIFLWFVPYLRSLPTKSPWKSLKLMFISQRLYRIVHSHELVSPNHSAKEMVTVLKNRQFEKLFQKDTKGTASQQKQMNGIIGGKASLCDLSNQIIALRRQQPAGATASVSGSVSHKIELDFVDIATQTMEEDLFLHCTPSSSSSSGTTRVIRAGGNTGEAEYIELHQVSPSWHGDWDRSWLDEDDQSSDEHPASYNNESFTMDESVDEISVRIPPPPEFRQIEDHDQIEPDRRYSPPSPTSQQEKQHRDAPVGFSISMGNAALSKKTTNKDVNIARAAARVKSFPLKDNRVKSSFSKSRNLSINNSLLESKADVPLESLTKENLFLMWKQSEAELNAKLENVLAEKELLERKLSLISPSDLHWV